MSNVTKISILMNLPEMATINGDHDQWIKDELIAVALQSNEDLLESVERRIAKTGKQNPEYLQEIKLESEVLRYALEHARFAKTEIVDQYHLELVVQNKHLVEDKPVVEQLIDLLVNPLRISAHVRVNMMPGSGYSADVSMHEALSALAEELDLNDFDEGRLTFIVETNKYAFDMPKIQTAEERIAGYMASQNQ